MLQQECSLDVAWVLQHGDTALPGLLRISLQRFMRVCKRTRQSGPVWSSDPSVCGHVHAGGKQAGWHIRPVPFKLLLRKAPRSHAATCGFKCEPDHHAGWAEGGREGGDGVRREKRGWSLYHMLTQQHYSTRGRAGLTQCFTWCMYMCACW